MGRALRELLLSAEVGLGEIDDLSVAPTLLDEVDVGVGTASAEAELHSGVEYPQRNDMNASNRLPIQQILPR